MKAKFWYLVSKSFQKKAKSKWFIVANILLLLAIVAVANIDRIITYFGGEFDEKKEILVIDETQNNTFDLFSDQIQNVQTFVGTDYNIEVIKREEDLSSLKEEIKDTKKVLIVLQNDELHYLKASIFSFSYIDSSYYQYLYQALSNVKASLSLSMSSIDVDVYNRVVSPIQVERVILEENTTSEGEMTSMIMGTVFPTLILPFFILVVFLVQMIGMEINEEKSSRSMEIIISNVSPKVHFFSKIVAGNAFVLLQTLLLFSYGIIALLVRNFVGGSLFSGQVGTYVNGIVSSFTTAGLWDQLVYIIPLALILMILSFITYSLIAGILASMTVNMEDFQQIQTPIMFICMIGYYLAIMAGMFHGSVFIRILSYVPFLSSLLSPALFITGQIHFLDVIISIIILVVFNWILIKFGLKIYKIGILNYSTDKMWSKIFKAVKERVCK